jgi:hypothetical protein
MNNLPAVSDIQRSVFYNVDSFELGQRMAKVLAGSKLVPTQYQGNLSDCIIALELAQRIGASPMAVMQNTYVIHGRPSFSAQFVIAMVNSCGRYSPLRFETTGTGDHQECFAWAYELSTGEKLTGPPVSIKMAKAEQWYQKNGSKWQTMPELMLRYRAAAFFGRLYAPELLMGMRTVDEQLEATDESSVVADTAQDLNERFAKTKRVEMAQDSEPDPAQDIEPVIEAEIGEVDMAIFEKEVAALDKIKDPVAVDKWRLNNSDRVLQSYAPPTATAIMNHAAMVYQILSAEVGA